jgi:OHCU decarboxylase
MVASVAFGYLDRSFLSSIKKLPDNLSHLNSLPVAEAREEFLKCCGSTSWAQQMTAERPFPTTDDLLETANRVWWSLHSRDWLEAFRSHPKIGEKKAAATVTTQAQEWSEDEQSGTRGTADETMLELTQLNRQYEEKFGFIFIICASGKSSEEMLSELRRRLANDEAQELRNAAAEQARITELRLLKLLAK